MAIEITKIVIRMGKKDVELTLDEAKELSESLKLLFPNPIVVSYPVVAPVIERWIYPHWKPWRVTCERTGLSSYVTTATLCKAD